MMLGDELATEYGALLNQISYFGELAKEIEAGSDEIVRKGQEEEDRGPGAEHGRVGEGGQLSACRWVRSTGRRAVWSR